MQQKVRSSSYLTAEAAGMSRPLPQNNQLADGGRAANLSQGRKQRTPSQNDSAPFIPTASSGRQNHPQQDEHNRNSPSFAPQQRRNRRILTPLQAAEFLGFDDKTITRWARQDYLPAHPTGQGKKKYWRFFEDELIDWLNGQTNGAVAA